MPPTITCALAQTFTHTSAAPDVVLTFASGVTPVNASLATGDYRMCLAPSVGDFLRALAAAVSAALDGARGPGNYVVTCALDSAGVVTFTVDAGGDLVPMDVTFATAVWRRLGFSGNKPGGTIGNAHVAVGVRPCWYLATFIERVSQDWAQKTTVATAETESGVGYGVTSGITRWTDEVTFGFVPRDPTFRSDLGVPQTAWEPAPAYLTTLGTLDAREFSVSDLLATGIGKTHAYAAGNFQALLTSTTERYHLVTIPGRECGAPRLARLRDGWDAYRRWTTGLIRQSAATGTRA